MKFLAGEPKIALKNQEKKLPRRKKSRTIWQ